jgi:hypothetical protein
MIQPSATSSATKSTTVALSGPILAIPSLSGASTLVAIDVDRGKRSGTASFQWPDILRSITSAEASFDSAFERIAAIGPKAEQGGGSLSAGYYDRSGTFTTVTLKEDTYGKRKLYDAAVFVNDHLVAHTSDGWLVEAATGGRVAGQSRPFYLGDTEALIVDADNHPVPIPRVELGRCVLDPKQRGELICPSGTNLVAGKQAFGSVSKIGYVADAFNDGSALWAGKDGVLYLISRAGGPERALTPATDFQITSARLSPDEKAIAYTAYRDGVTSVWRVKASGGTPQRLIPDEFPTTEQAVPLVRAWR